MKALIIFNLIIAISNIALFVISLKGRKLAWANLLSGSIGIAVHVLYTSL